MRKATGKWRTISATFSEFRANPATKEYLDKFRENFIAGWGGYPLVGTAEQVTDKLVELSRTGVDGTLISLVDYNAELPYWNEKVMPLLEQAGLRKPLSTKGVVAA